MKPEEILVLSKLPGIGRIKIIKALRGDEEAMEAIDILRGNKTLYREALDKASSIIDSCGKMGIGLAGFFDSTYPPSFREISDPPPVFFYKGCYELLLDRRAVAVVGTRTPSRFGAAAAERITSLLVQRGYSIVSGLAAGCDTVAHATCIKGGGRTTAILPCGIDSIYPPSNRGLADSIVKNGGCLITEYPPGEGVMPYKFIERDRLQSALSRAVIIVETSLDGGAMHTATFCRKYERLLCAVVHPENFNGDIQGNLKLLEDEETVPLKGREDVLRLIDRLDGTELSNIIHK